MTRNGGAAALLLLLLALGGCGSSDGEGAATGRQVRVDVASPADGAVIKGDRVTVRGTVTPADATVQVQGRAASVGNGVFVATATVHRGKTTIDVIGSAPGATPGSTTVRVTRPRKPKAPTLTTTTTTTTPAPTPPTEPETSGQTWPRGTSGWTVILVSESTAAAARAAAERGSAAGLADTGTLWSSEHSSLRPGYWVAYSGVLSNGEAKARAAQARASGFPSAYARFVSAG